MGGDLGCGGISQGGNGGGAGGQTLYDGVDTTANILAMNPTTFLGEVWWSSDDKISYEAVTVEGTDVWQQVGLVYDTDTDTFCLPTTQDGQGQNLGQEIFRLGINTEVTTATELNPRIFSSIGANVVDGRYSDMIFADAANITQGMLLAVNTTEAVGNGGKFKFAGWGQLSNVNTSLWSLNAVLFLDTLNPGEFTAVQPATNAFPVARVDKVGATDGTLFVVLLTTNRIDLELIPTGFNRFFITGDEETTTEGTFFLDGFNNRGTVATDSIIAVCPDDTTVTGDQQVLGAVLPVTTTLKAGVFAGRQEFSINAAGGQEQIIWEVYKADGQGVVIDSGFAGEPVGSLGVKTAFRSFSATLNSPTATIIGAELTSILSEDLTLTAGQRLRTVIRARKVGTTGGDKTFTMFVGSDHLTFIDSPIQTTTDSVVNLSNISGASLTDALNGIDSSDIANDSTIPGSTVTDALDVIATVGVIRDAPGGAMSASVSPDTQLSVSTTPVLIDVFNTSNLADRVTVDPANAIFTVDDAGRYLVGMNFAVAPASNNTTITIGIHVNGSGTASVDIPILARTAGENIPINFTFPIDANASDTVDFRISIDAGTQTITYDEASAYVVQQAVGLATLEGAVEEFSGFIETGVDKTYTLIQRAEYPRTIDELTVQSDSGTINYTVSINGTPITGISSVSVSSVEANAVATALNDVVADDKITLVAASNSSAVDVAFTLKSTRV